MALLEIHDLHTFFKTKKGIVKAVNGVSYSVEPGKTLGVVGESGSGKTTVIRAVLGALPGAGQVTSGDILFHGESLLKRSADTEMKLSLICHLHLLFLSTERMLLWEKK